jgi:hypothetical protein
MIHHISFAVHNPLHVAEVVAELWQGKTASFPGHSDSFIALTFDAYGTAIEFIPKGTAFKPGSEENESVEWIPDLDATGYTATHVNMAVPISEAQIYAIANREGWRAVRCNRQGLFDLIEFWIENEIMMELLPPNLMEKYLSIVQPESLKAIFNQEF